VKSPLDIKIASYPDVKVPFTKLKRRRIRKAHKP